MANLMVFCALVCVGVQSVRSASVLRTVNVNSGYGKWNKTNIPYYYDITLSPTEQGYIDQAIAAVQAALPTGCLTFNKVLSTAQIYKLLFTPLTRDSGTATPQTYCYSYPGVNRALQANSLEQVVSLARGATGCFPAVGAGTATSYCKILKYIVVALGKRNEHQRGDRDTWVTVDNTKIGTGLAPAYTKYLATEAYWSLFAYDHCSITHNQPSDFSTGGSVYTLTAASMAAGITTMPNLCTLSLTDCKLLSMMYGCDSTACKQPSCVAQAAAAAPAPPAGCTNFCTATIDEGMLWQGQEYVFSGACFAKFSAGMIQIPTVALITTLFTATPALTATDGIQDAWMSGNVNTSPTLNILLKSNVAYTCTGTTAPFICTQFAGPYVPPKAVATSEAVLDSINSGTGVISVITIDQTGQSYSYDSAPATVITVANTQCPPFPTACTTTTVAGSTTNLATWNAAWNSATPGTLTIIGKTLSGASMVQSATDLTTNLGYSGDATAYC